MALASRVVKSDPKINIYFLRSVKKIPYAFLAFRAIQIWENACYLASCMGKFILFYFPRFRRYIKKLVKIKELAN
jgi:hypothetical protein